MDEVQSVHLLGNAQALPFQLTAEGLIVTLLTQKPCDHAYVLKITGLDLKASRSAPPPLPVIQVAAVSTMTLLPDSAIVSKTPVPRTGGWDRYQANPGDKLTILAEGTALLHKWHTVGALLAAPSKFRL